MNRYRKIIFLIRFRYLITDFCHKSGYYSEAKEMLIHAQSIYSNNFREVITPKLMRRPQR
jgi:hypothetical protein